MLPDALRSPVTRSTLSDSVYETLLEAIVAGRLSADTVLTSVQLAEQLRVSRTPVQEALRKLAADGLVVCTAGHRARVVRFSREDALEIYDLRILLEGESAARAALRATPEEVAEMRRRLEELLNLQTDVDWCVRALECDLWFHEQLARAAQSSRLQAEIDRYRLLVRSFCRIVGSTQNLLDAVQEHLNIVSALEKRDPEAARAAMASHIEARLQVVLHEIFDSPSTTE
ncbi:GntR family transcriptional regulator [Planctomicrobium sp. SH661]|uniref:GntR family transcriptional regulator n=1 Tax=Planctomicrobium sp. SH661 TaxID=3448124 RepID=UPI003F5B87C8